MEKNKKKALYIAYMIIMVIFTVIYSLIMVCMAGAGLIYNGDSYGRELVNVGIWLIISGVLMTAGAVVCFFKKRIFSIVSAVLTIAGLAVCLIMLYILCTHADSAGWADNYTMEPVSRMYRERLLPVIAPAVMTLGVDFFKSR
ncbi:MAG: hypothetical protein IKV85_04060 [Ruminococcus sp.]|nr:hypothetical protein [Ruminococcus sp.]